eukprot:350101-Chlamydomonas_euryale.AAC.1
MDEDRLPRQVFDCSLARSVAEDGRVEQVRIRPGHRNINDLSGMYSSPIQGCHEKVPVVCATRQPGGAVDPGPGLKIWKLLSKKASVKSKELKSVRSGHGGGLRYKAAPRCETSSARNRNRCVQRSGRGARPACVLRDRHGAGQATSLVRTGHMTWGRRAGGKANDGM